MSKNRANHVRLQIVVCILKSVDEIYVYVIVKQNLQICKINLALWIQKHFATVKPPAAAC